MRSVNFWRAKSLANLAVVFLGSIGTAYSADPAPAAKSAMPAEANAVVAPTPQSSPQPLAQPASPAPEKSSVAGPAVPAKAAEKLRFQFRAAPWKEVLAWFAQQANLSLQADVIPQGTFNYTDTHEYTPGEAIDVLNRVLQTKGFLLVRGTGRMLMLINTEDPIPPNLVPTVPVESLDSRGESELVNVHFKLTMSRPDKLEPEVHKLLGPAGSIVALANSLEMSVTDTVWRLRAVRAYLASVERNSCSRVEDLPPAVCPCRRRTGNSPPVAGDSRGQDRGGGWFNPSLAGGGQQSDSH